MFLAEGKFANWQILAGGFIHSWKWLDYSRNAGVAKLADALDLGSSVRKDVSSSPTFRTKKQKDPLLAGLSI
jgi:hypothetical protein